MTGIAAEHEPVSLDKRSTAEVSVSASDF